MMNDNPFNYPAKSNIKKKEEFENEFLVSHPSTAKIRCCWNEKLWRAQTF